jgi:hypothetical protein
MSGDITSSMSGKEVKRFQQIRDQGGNLGSKNQQNVVRTIRGTYMASLVTSNEVILENLLTCNCH